MIHSNSIHAILAGDTEHIPMYTRRMLVGKCAMSEKLALDGRHFSTFFDIFVGDITDREWY
jgi:hypothetical protein